MADEGTEEKKQTESKSSELKWEPEKEDAELKEKTWPYKMATNGKHADFKLCNLNKVSLSLHMHAVLKATYRPIIMINISYFLRKKGKV